VDEETLDLMAVIPPSIEHMRCAAHTLQLAVFDGIKNSRAEGIIGRIRNVVKEGRTPKISEIIRKRTKKILLLDMDTRWGSTFMMVDRLIELKAAVQEIADCGNRTLLMTVPQWEQAEELRNLLLKAYEVTKKLQYADISPGYFYRKWSGLRLFYENNGSLLTTEIAQSMKRREAELFNNGLLLAAVLLDFNNMELLPPASVETAKKAVSNLALRLQGLEDPDVIAVEDNEVTICSEEDTDSDEDMRSLRKKQRPSCSSSDSDEELPDVETAAAAPSAPRPMTPAGTRKSPDVKAQIVNGVNAGIEKLMEQRSAMKKTKKNLLTVIEEDYPLEIKDVARLLCAKPVTQVSVERLFSALKIFKRDHRSRLKEDILNALLLLKANQ